MAAMAAGKITPAETDTRPAPAATAAPIKIQIHLSTSGLSQYRQRSGSRGVPGKVLGLAQTGLAQTPPAGAIRQHLPQGLSQTSLIVRIDVAHGRPANLGQTGD